MAAAGAGAALSAPPTSLTPIWASPPRLLRRRRANPLPGATPCPRPKKPPPLSCAAAATPTPAPAAAKAGSWKDLCSLNAWVVRDYRRLVDSVGALEPALRRFSDEQVVCCGTPAADGFFDVAFGDGFTFLGVADEAMCASACS